MAQPRKKNDSKVKSAGKQPTNGKKLTQFQNKISSESLVPPSSKPQQSVIEVPREERVSPPQYHPVYEDRREHQIAKELPDNYGDNQIYLLVRDPYWIYSYWEIQHWHQQRALAELGGNWDNVKSILRIHDVTNPDGASFFDITLSGLANSWYLETQPNHTLFVEIGLLRNDGRFLALARSNTVTTPRAGMSDVIDEQWMSIDFDKLYALSGGFQVGRSSLELKQLMEERLRGAISSGSGVGLISSISSPVKIRKRGFWFVLDCELIVYGATEPDAKVVFQGKEIKLRPDGTFSLRFALPDGRFVLDAHAFSADGIEERVIIPTVTRTTERPAPILKPDNNK